MARALLESHERLGFTESLSFWSPGLFVGLSSRVVNYYMETKDLMRLRLRLTIHLKGGPRKDSVTLFFFDEGSYGIAQIQEEGLLLNERNVKELRTCLIFHIDYADSVLVHGSFNKESWCFTRNTSTIQHPDIRTNWVPTS